MFNAMVPLLGWPINKHLIEDITRMREEYGIRRFLLIGPVYASVMIHGLPSEEAFRIFAEELLHVKQYFASTDVEIGWWCVCTMDNGAEHPEFQHVVNHDGAVSPNGLCPLDEAWRKEFLKRIKIIAEIAHPWMILIEDDFELSNQVKVNFGCFCPLHLKALSQKIGRDIDREGLIDIYKKEDPDSTKIKETFTQIVRESIFLLARQMRETVNTVDPAIQLGMCEPIASDRDGYLSQLEPAILAGDSAQPLIRVEGSIYSCRNAASSIPETLSHAMYTFERMPENYDVIHETDTYPHTRYFMSGHYFNALLQGSVACGAHGTLLYGTQYLDDPLEDDGYFQAYAKYAKKIEALSEALKGTELDGLHIIYSPELKQRQLPDESQIQLLPSLADLPGRFGIPYSTKNGSIALLIGDMAKYLSDETVMKLLAGGLMLDAQAAENLYQRGFGQYLGAKVTPMDAYRFCQEILCDIPELAHVNGRHMYNYATYPAGSEKDHAPYVELTPEGAEECSIFADYDGNKTNSACLRFQNSLGGRVVLFAAGFVGNGTSNLFCYRKKELFRALLEWADRKPLSAVVMNRANVWLLARHSAQKSFFMITDMNGDDERPLTLKLAPEYRQKQFAELQMDGSWKQISLQWQDEATAVIPGEFRRLDMRVFVAE